MSPRRKQWKISSSHCCTATVVVETVILAYTHNCSLAEWYANRFFKLTTCGGAQHRLSCEGRGSFLRSSHSSHLWHFQARETDRACTPRWHLNLVVPRNVRNLLFALNFLHTCREILRQNPLHQSLALYGFLLSF